MRCARLLQAALACCCASVSTAGEAPDVAVFTLSTIPVQAGGAAVYQLDRPERLGAAFGAALPADPDRALAAAQRRLDTAAGRALRRELAEVVAGKALAVRLGIDRLPAIVVDGRYVVYGVREVRRALVLAAEWRAANETPVVSGPGNTRSTPHPLPGTPPARSARRERGR